MVGRWHLRQSRNEPCALKTSVNILRRNPRKTYQFYSDDTGRFTSSRASGQVTRLRNPPTSLYNNGLVGALTVDPVSGRYLALTPNTGQLYAHDVLTDVWQTQSSSEKPNPGWFVIATPVGTYGVNLFVSCSDASSCHVYLYKHSASGPPAGDTTQPSVSISSPDQGSILSGTTTVSANASDNVGVAGVKFMVDGNDPGSEDTTSPYSVSWNTANAGIGPHTLSAVARDAAGNRTTPAPVMVMLRNQTTDSNNPPVTSTPSSSSFVQK